MIGLGTQDNLALARDFVAKGGISFRMFWDPSFQSWVQLRVRSQPAAILFAPDGARLGAWSGAFNERDVLGLIR